MNFVELGALGEVVAALATVGTLGYLAVQMLALANDDYAAALKQNKLDQVARVKKMDAEVNGRDA